MDDPDRGPPVLWAWPRLAAARAEAHERQRALLAARAEAHRAAEAAYNADGDAYWAEREAFLLRAQRGKKLAQLLAHDLKNHLAVVKTNVEFALYDLPEGAAGRAPVERAAQAVDESFALAAELVAIEDLEAPQPVPAPLGAAALLAAVAAALAPTARSRSVALSVEAEPDLVLQADARLLGRALHNLAENAIVHAGATFVRLRGGTDAQGVAELRVEDDGAGLPAAAQASLTARPPGSAPGGLDFCCTAIEAVGGTLFHRAGSPRGSALCIRLPTPARHARAA